MSKIKLNFRAERSQAEKVKRIARAMGKSESELFREMIDNLEIREVRKAAVVTSILNESQNRVEVFQ